MYITRKILAPVIVPAIFAWTLLPHAVSAAPRSGATVPHIAGARDLGPLPPATPVHLVAGLRLRNLAQLQQLILRESERGPLYHRFLTPAQARDAFSPTPAAYARVLVVLRSAGFRITRTDPMRTMVSVTAPAVVVQRYFATTLHLISVPHARGTIYQNVTPARLPAALAVDVDAVAGFSNSPLIARSSGARPQSTTHAFVSPPPPEYGPDNGYGPQLIAGAFDLPSRHGFFGVTATLADVTFGFALDADINTYLSYFHIRRLPTATLTNITIDGGCAFFIGECDVLTASADAEAIIGTEPGTAVQIYDTPPTNTGVLDAYSAILAAPPMVVNFPYGQCELTTGEAALIMDHDFQLGAAEGITFVNQSGAGSHACSDGFPAVQAPVDSPNALASGGADSFVDQYGNVTRNPIADVLSGGGVSLLFAEPSYQAGLPGTSPAGRNVPDIAGPAAINTVGPSVYCNFPAVGCYPGGWHGGLPYVFSAPVAAAIAGVDGGLHSGIGFINPGLYAIFRRAGYGTSATPIFRDVTIGCNGLDAYPPYCATPGYDLVTGIGAPDFWNIIQAAV